MHFVINSNLFHDFATKNSLPVAFGQGTRTNLRLKSSLSSSHSDLFILLSTSGIIYLFYTTKDFPHFLKESLFFEPIKIYSIKVIEKIVNFI